MFKVKIYTLNENLRSKTWIHSQFWSWHWCQTKTKMQFHICICDKIDFCESWQDWRQNNFLFPKRPIVMFWKHVNILMSKVHSFCGVNKICYVCRYACSYVQMYFRKEINILKPELHFILTKKTIRPESGHSRLCFSIHWSKIFPETRWLWAEMNDNGNTNVAVTIQAKSLHIINCSIIV